MIKLRHNPLLFWSLAAVGIYTVAGIVLPSPYLSSTASLMLLIFGSVTFARYIRDALRIVFQGERSEEGDGAHLAALGVTAVAAGSIYVGLFGLIWVYVQQPPDWLGTWYSGIGRAIQAAGFALLFFSPDVAQKRFRLPGGIWLVIAAAAALLMAFLLGWTLRHDENMATFRLPHRDATTPVCPSDRQVIGSSRAHIYHVPGSPYRQKVVPSRCFRSVAEAQANGFRAPKQ